MTEPYEPPKVWVWETGQVGSGPSSGNRPTADTRFESELPVGKHPLQLYSMATPNGQKITIMLEELLNAGVEGAEYDAHMISIGKGDQFGSGFVDINPNSKIPTLVDYSENPPLRVFESASILMYLAEKFGHLLPTDTARKAETRSWLCCAHAWSPFLGGGFGHFYHYAPEKLKYPIDRFTMETKRQLDVMDQQLAKKKYIAGDEYTIADIALWPWHGCLVLGDLWKGSDVFVDAIKYTYVLRWANEIASRRAVIRGRIVNRVWGPEYEQLSERHSAADIDQVLAKKK